MPWTLLGSSPTAGQVQPTVCLVNKSFIGTQPHLFISRIVYSCFHTKTAEPIVLTESIWLAKPKIFTICPLEKKCVDPCNSLNLDPLARLRALHRITRWNCRFKDLFCFRNIFLRTLFIHRICVLYGMHINLYLFYLQDDSPAEADRATNTHL